MNVLIIDEVSMIRRETFEDLDIAFKNIKQNLLPFGGLSLLLIGDSLQLSPVNQKRVFIKPSKGSNSSYSMNGCGKNFNYMNWLKTFGRAVIQILFSC